MPTTIAVTEETRKKLLQLKIDENFKNMDDLIKRMIIDHKIAKFSESAALFQERMKKYDLKLSDLVE